MFYSTNPGLCDECIVLNFLKITLEAHIMNEDLKYGMPYLSGFEISKKNGLSSNLKLDLTLAKGIMHKEGIMC